MPSQKAQDPIFIKIKEELERRGKVVSDDQINLFLASRNPNQQAEQVSPGVSTARGLGIETMPIGPTRDEKDNIFDFAGSLLWHAFDTATFGVPGIALGEDAPYKFGEMGAYGNVGAVFGEALGFFGPIMGVGALTKGAVRATSKFSTKAATTRAAEAAASIAGGLEKGLVDPTRAARTVKHVLGQDAAKLLPSYSVSTAAMATAGRELDFMIRAGLKKEFKGLGDDTIAQISKAATNELSKGGVHINSIGKAVERSLNTKFSVADRSKITAYIGRAADLTTNFAIVNLMDDAIKSSLVEGHHFDPIADVGSALMFSAFLPAVEAIPWGGKMHILRTRKAIKRGLQKVKDSNYDNLTVNEINSIFKILSNNNQLSTSSFAIKASQNVSGVFKEKEKDIAVKELQKVLSDFAPPKVWSEFRKAALADIGAGLPKMALGAAYFNSSTLIDGDMLRNIESEVLGAHLIVGALFTRRYKPILPEKMPSLNDFDKKVAFLRILGMDATDIESLGKAYGDRVNTGYAYMGLLGHPIMRQISELLILQTQCFLAYPHL